MLKEENIILKTHKKPKVIAISYGDGHFKKQLEFNKKSALEIGEVNEYYSYGPNDINIEKKTKKTKKKKKGMVIGFGNPILY